MAVLTTMTFTTYTFMTAPTTAIMTAMWLRSLPLNTNNHDDDGDHDSMAANTPLLAPSPRNRYSAPASVRPTAHGFSTTE